ncbi:MAG: hypothetical protein R3F16_06965 [Myxococcota bacterium]
MYCGPFSPDAYDEWVLDLRARLEEGCAWSRDASSRSSDVRAAVKLASI